MSREAVIDGRTIAQNESLERHGEGECATMKTTIVTAADSRFVWGSFLLLASLRYNKIDYPVNVLGFGLSNEDKALLLQFPDVSLFDANLNDPRNIACQKAQAIYTAENTDCIAWIDSDCVATGKITPYFATQPGHIRIRMRPPKEIAYLFRARYESDEEKGGMPRRVLDIWRQDVGNETNPKVNTSCNACAFVINTSDVDFIKRWEAQIQKVIPPEDKGIVNDRSFAYFLLDESVMASMLAFDEGAPQVTEYLFEGNALGQLVHLGGTPKPWQLWSISHLPWFHNIMDAIDHAKAQGYRLPSQRWVFHRKLLPLYTLVARIYDIYHVGKRWLRDRAKKILRRLKNDKSW